MAKQTFRAAVIGAGASGILAAVKLREAGIDMVVFEKAPDLGGTWRDNTYPGVCCDVPSLAYRYSFAPNPDWSQVCAPGGEIQEYLRHTAHSFAVADFIRLDTEIVRAVYEVGRWRLTSAYGDEGQFDVVVTATGVLHHPVYPDIPGRQTFAGASFHSARWDHEALLAGKRVGIIGSGSTATQILCALVDTTESVTLFQRTAQWVLPLPNREITQEEKKSYQADPDLLEAEYLRLTSRMNATFSAAIVGENPGAYASIVKQCEDHLATVRDPTLRKSLTPSFQVGCKRLIMSDDFYVAVEKPGASVVTNRIMSFRPEGLECADGSIHALDVIVMATGFDTHRFFRPMDVVGEGGRSLDAAWSTRNQGYLTVATPGFPNWFMIGGPSSPIGNFSWILTAETQFSYIMQCIERLRAGDLQAMAPRQQAADAFNVAIAEKLPSTVWATGCSSWYIDSSGNVASWPWTFRRFQDDLVAPRWEDFELASAAL